MRTSRWIFRACVGGALGAALGTAAADYIRRPSPELRQAVARQLMTGMMKDFYACTAPKIAEVVGTGAFDLHPRIIRRIDMEDGMPSQHGGSMRIETSQPDFIQRKIATMVTELDFETGKISKYRWNYVGGIHEARHDKVVAEAKTCLNARGPMV